MRYTNLHTHSNYSDGKHTLEENVLSAIDKNMAALGFSDHSFTPCDTSYCMGLERYDGYYRELQKLKARYDGKIRLFAGMELDYDSQMPALELDYIIASVHYIVSRGVTYPIDHTQQQQRDCIREVFGGDVIAMARCYFEQLAEHVERIRPTVVGHFDVITKFSIMPEADDRYRAVAEDALKRILKTCPYIEMNTGAISRGYRTTPYPCTYLLDTVRENGGRIVLGSDSHHKDNLTFYFDEAVQLLKEKGFYEIHAFNGTGFDVQPI